MNAVPDHSATADDDRPVWYACYGSNLWAERFAVYLTGGPIPGAAVARHQRGARDPRPWRDDRPVELDRGLRFVGASRQWGGGGTAVIDHAAGPSPTLARAYGITLGQFADVVAQENGLDEATTLDPSRLAAGPVVVADRRYGRVEQLGEIDGAPLLTFTNATDTGPPTTAHVSYLRAMARGLAECWGLDAAEAAAYLAARPGNHGVLDPDALRTSVR